MTTLLERIEAAEGCLRQSYGDGEMNADVFSMFHDVLLIFRFLVEERETNPGEDSK